MNVGSRVAVITGASQGIGAALVRAFRDRNYKVVATSRSMERFDHPAIVAVSGDIGDPATGRQVVEAAINNFGRIDTLVNNAGISRSSPFTSYSEDVYRQMVSTNIHGFFHITQCAVKVMEDQGSGHIVSVTTTLAELANSKVPAVVTALTKGAINSATKSLAIEYAKRGIRVNAVAPGIIKTPMHSEDTWEAKDAMHPIGHMGEISDVVGAILYLEDAPFVTGEILHVDGGQSAGR